MTILRSSTASARRAGRGASFYIHPVRRSQCSAQKEKKSRIGLTATGRTSVASDARSKSQSTRKHRVSWRQSWDKQPRRVIAKIEWHPPGELVPTKVGFMRHQYAQDGKRGLGGATSTTSVASTCRGSTCKEGKYAFRWTRLSCRKFFADRRKVAAATARAWPTTWPPSCAACVARANRPG